MSLPPLVCSTPPPPDQCDDKDIEDFDMHYRLSQEDDECQDYDYGNFSSFNHFQAATKEKQLNSLPATKIIHNNNPPVSSSPEHGQVIITRNINISSQIKNPKSENELVEDLDFEIGRKNNENHDDTIEDSLVNAEPATQCETITNIHFNKETSSNLHSVDVEETFSNGNCEITAISNSLHDQVNTVVGEDLSEKNFRETIENSNIDNILITDDVNQSIKLDSITSLADEYSVNNDKEEHIDETDTFQFTKKMISSDSNDQSSKNITLNVIEEGTCNKVDVQSIVDDDFGDFEDFKMSGTEYQTPAIISDTANPWENQTCDNNFGNFEANFEQVSPRPEKISSSTTYQSNHVNEDYDFGDFDDFKTAPVRKESLKAIETKQLSEEDIVNVIKETFGVDDIDRGVQYEGKLESQLCETWRHLKEIDIRQPYMINWNNTSGQKTLLKALCIDSRNILFAPKWGQTHNMPKFAANLSSAPLQPQKSLSTAATSSEPSSCIKPADTWVDPTASNNQESCIDDGSSVACEEPIPFKPPVPTTPDCLFELTSTGPPLRQINLPDTHIYTPTDSDIPWSTTIHYGSGSAAVLPQTIINDKIHDEEYTDFQDYKSTSSVIPNEPNTMIDQDKPKVRHESEILQPIKLEPVIPTLDWPEPGQVKNTEFTDFVSNINWSNDPVQSTSSATAPQDLTSLEKPENKLQPAINIGVNDLCDDDFNSFQSAKPHQKNAFKDLNIITAGLNSITNIENKSSLEKSKPISSFDVDFSALENIGTNSNSNVPTSILSTNTKHNSDLSSFSSLPVTSFPTMKPQHVENSSILQPTSLSGSTAQVKQASGQILQPLSLESYSQINWPNPGLDIQDWSRFNPVDTIQTLKTDLTAGGSSTASPSHSQKGQTVDDDWGEFVSSRPVQKPQNKQPSRLVLDDDEWTDFVSSSVVKPANGVNTISFNVHSNLSSQKSANKAPQVPLDIPSLNYITPKINKQKAYTDSHFQNL